MERIRVAIWGTGRAGTELVKVGLTRPWVDLRAGIVFTPEKAGRDLGEIAGERSLGIPATLDADAVLARDDIDLVFFAGLGNNEEVAACCERALAAGKDVVTVTNLYHPVTALGEAKAAELDATAKRSGARMVSTGLFPGFLMDFLPVATLSNIVSFEELRCERVADMSRYGDGVLREGFRIGLPAAEGKLEATFAGFFAESLATMADSLGVQVKEQSFSQEPILTDVARETERYRIEPGTICGHRLRLEAPLTNGSRIVMQWQGTFRLQPEVDGFEPMARVTVTGYPNLDLLVTGDMFADTYPTTAARALAAVRPLRAMPPGVYTITQIPLAPAFY